MHLEKRVMVPYSRPNNRVGSDGETGCRSHSDHQFEPKQWCAPNSNSFVSRPDQETQPLARLQGREGAAFSIYWGEVSADSDGPMEWCKPVPVDEAVALASQYPELSLRTGPAHREAFVSISPAAGDNGGQWQLASEALRAWAIEHGINPKNLALKPEDLGVRITYLVSEPVTATSVPDCDFAVPFALTDSVS